MYCNLPPTNPEDGTYEYATSSLIFISLSFIGVHFLFIWLEAFRFVEVIVFQFNKNKLKKLKQAQMNRSQKRKKDKAKKKKKLKKRKIMHGRNSSNDDIQDYQSVDMDELSKSINDNQLIGIIVPNDNVNDGDDDNEEDSDHPLNDDNHEPVSIEEVNNDINNDQGVHDHVPDFDVNEWIEGMFVYGVDHPNHNNNHNNNGLQNGQHGSLDSIGGGHGVHGNNDRENSHFKHLQKPSDTLNNSHNNNKSSLSQFWKATTGIVTTGFILTLTAEDICCICWDEFQIGTKIAKLSCGHIIHKQCAIEWFEQSVTCPTCRVSLEKN